MNIISCLKKWIAPSLSMPSFIVMLLTPTIMEVTTFLSIVIIEDKPFLASLTGFCLSSLVILPLSLLTGAIAALLGNSIHEKLDMLINGPKKEVTSEDTRLVSHSSNDLYGNSLDMQIIMRERESHVER